MPNPTDRFTLPKPTKLIGSNVLIKGNDQLHGELIRSKIVDALAQAISTQGIDPNSFEFGLVIKT